jgi:hypothetical protein
MEGGVVRMRCTGLALTLLAAAALLLAAAPMTARALVNCSAPGAGDTDGDGFTDLNECSATGIQLVPGLSLTDGTTTVTSVANCAAIGLPPGSALCLSPDVPDLFIFLVVPNPAFPLNPDEADPLNHLPAVPFQLISNSEATGGLGIAPHVIKTSDPTVFPPDRVVSLDEPLQKAIQITVDLNPNGEVFGVAIWGTPRDDPDGSVFFPVRIENFVVAKCNEANPPDSCTGPNNTVGAAQISPLYKLHTLNHEAGHLIRLMDEYKRRFGGYHLKQGVNFVMEQHVKVTTKGGKVEFFVSTEYSDASKAAKAFK